MKLTDILTEALSLSRYHDKLSQIIIHIFNKNIDLSKEEITVKLARALQKECRNISKVVTNDNYAIKVQFKDIDSLGVCDGLHIKLHKKLLTPIFKKIANVNAISELVGFLLHELVHAIQNIQQYKKGIDDSDREYRSYLEKDNEKFNTARMKDTVSPEEYKMYYASPQEIRAFAHNLAIEIITKHFKKSTYIENEDISKVVRTFLSNVFTKADKENPKIAKVINKYYSLVYREVMDYIESKDERS